MILGLEGAIAMSPIEITRSLSNTGKNIVPALTVFQIPPVAVATQNAFGFPGTASMSVTRPAIFAGPIDRHRKPARVVESSGVVSCAEREPAQSSALARAGRTGWARIVLDGS